MDLDFGFCYYVASSIIYPFQVKAIAENVDKAVRELPDANLVGFLFSYFFLLLDLLMSFLVTAFIDFPFLDCYGLVIFCACKYMV